MTNLLTNIILTVLSILCTIAFTTLNIILSKEARERELTFSEIIAENQDTKFGKTLMSIVSLPTAIVLKLLTFKKVDTTSIFNIPKGMFIYLEDEGTFGTFAFNNKNYKTIKNSISELPNLDSDIEEYIIVKPNTLDGLCSMIDITNKLGLKQINE